MKFSDEDSLRWKAKIQVDPSGCWIWTGSKNHKGYGQFKLEGKTHLAHRLSYWLAHGDPGDLQVRHLCPGGHRPACVNPDHLDVGTNDDNAQDKVRSGSALGINQGIRNGRAKLTDEQVLEIYKRVHDGEDGRDLALVFGVTPGLVSQIKLGRTRRHLQLPRAKIVRRGPYERSKEPLPDGPTPKEIGRFLRRTRPVGGDCIVWIATLGNGYGIFNFRGSTIGAHRFAYWVANGELPESDVAHECGNRACVNPAHLKARTRAANMQNVHTRKRLREAAKGHRYRTKLTDDQIRQIKETYRDEPGLTDQEIVDRFKLPVGAAALAKIRKEQSGVHVHVDGFKPSARQGAAARGRRNGRSKLSEQQVHEIRRRGADEDAVVLAEEFQISRRTVDDIVAGRIWTHLSEGVLHQDDITSGADSVMSTEV